MAPLWATIALCISAVVASAHAAALATQDEYVVSADSSHKSTVPSVVDTTEKPLEPIKLSEMRVRSDIALRYARTSVVTHVRNPDARAQETTFRVLLPDTAFISGFTMTLSGKAYKAYVKEKEEAKQIYTQAVSQGLGAAHIATKARDSNHFTVSVNVEGNTTAVFDLRYEEFLVRRNGLYNHAINLHPGSFVPKMEVVVHIKESQKITTLRVPEVRTGNEVDATEKDPQNTKAVIKREDNEKEATITFTPDIKEQRRLAGIYVDKTKEKSSSDKYIGYSSTEEKDEDDLAVLGQFVVQYDVERSNNGEVLVNDGYFVHFLAPSSLPPLSKYAVFVLDTSGSMMGRKIVQLRNAMEAILSDLNPNDYFSIVEFNSDVKVHELKEADEEPPEDNRRYSYFNPRNTPVTLVPPSLATADNIAKAKVIVSRLNASGGTNIYSALEVALNLVAKGTQDENKTNSTTQFVDGNGAVAVANSEKTETKGKDLEPIIIFLTDGDPTVGETSTARILSFSSEKNSGDQRASLYSLAFGEDADRVFLRKLSLRNEGFMRHIYEAADAALQLHDFYRQVSSPLLSHVQFQYPEKQVKEGSVSRNKFRTINAGSEVVVVGQIQDEVTELTPQVSGFCGNDDGVGKKKYEISPKVAVKREKESYLPLERLWAYLTIKQLLDKRDAEDDHKADENSAEKKALAIALKYEFVTPLTSLVVVKPEEKPNAVDVESVDKASDSNTYLPLIVGPPGPSNAFLTSGGGYAYASYPGIPGPPPAFAPLNIPPLALDAAHFSDALMDVEDEMVYGPARHHSMAFSRPSPNFYRGGAFQIDSGYGVPFSRRHLHYISTTPALGVYYQPTTITSTASTPTTAPTTSAAPIGDYHLEEFVWAASLLNTTAGTLVVLGDNGTQVTMELTRDINPPKAEGGDEECSSGSPAVGAASPAGGVCVYLTRCAAARHIAAEDYAKSYCVVNDRYAGVCCPRAEVDKDSKKPSS